ncbi:DUF192 domain-containing protein [Pelagicoccus mobilis]|uniref:DUF192 domain-containing protein n=1 Tax=Pelagicoccus mobilis TaxID=415221 RepID=A0A934VLU5_9BACT|nr:DUF192 domain-containing protein [Pelagicoccus mobilis]MBK1878136.1 DUF192 domain-containing protein [Pelagicoccus mobilis]
MKRSLLLSILTAFCIAATSCSESEDSQPTMPETLQVGDKTITIEFAISRSEQTKGLMFRDGIDDDHGMLFIYKEPQRMSYWMKNVDFPIDIGFFTADGVLREIYPLYPQDTLSRKSIRDDMLYALETRFNWYSDNEIRPGAKLDLETVSQALAARGH